MANLPRRAYNQMRHSFGHKLDLDSLYVSNRRLAILAGVTPLLIDMCIGSCIAYTQQHKNLTHCPFCKEPRRANSKPRRQFSYLPLIPRLQGFFRNPQTVELLSYRAQYESSDTEIGDVFDGDLYKELRETYVTVDGVQRPYKFFSGKHDIALGVGMDGYLIFGKRGPRGGPTATPIIVKVYNFPGKIRTHIKFVMSLGIISGPKAPKDAGSFLAPFDDELVDLANGVRTYNCVDEAHFMLRAYTIFKLGDMLAINKMLGIRGHNAFAPCRSCHIKGCRNVTGGDTNYYVPLNHPRRPGEEHTYWDPTNLPLRTHQDYITTLRDMDHAAAARREEIGFNQGIREPPLLRRVNSLDFARSIPWDLMHLIMENIGPNLVDHWTGKFKHLDEGSGNYRIPDAIWEEIGNETAEATKSIPAAFVRALPNIAKDRSSFTAEAWCFWFVYLAPTLLKNRFQNNRYYQHLCEFTEIIKLCLRYSITRSEIDNDLEPRIINWVQDYEK